MNLTENSKKVLERRYLAKDENGRVVETVEELFERVAKSISEIDKKYDSNANIEELKNKFYDMMTNLDFLPNSPTLMNAGRPLGQLSACFVLPVGDSMEEIFDAVKYAAIIHKSGGGTGFSFSRLRPKGATVKSTGGVASGPVSFMKVFNSATEAVKQGGTRRGANMGILRIDHPDILEFIQCKQDNNEITNFNISVGITEDFMKAVEKGDDYELVDPHTKKVVNKLNAREVFKLIVEMAWKNGEPGIVFLDRINEKNPTPLVGEIESTNPCVTGDTLVSTEYGLMRIDEIYNKYQKGGLNIVTDNRVPMTQYQVVNGGYITEAIPDMNSKGTSLNRISKVYNNGEKDVIKLTLKSGYEIKATPDHRFLTPKGWKELSRIKIGDEILIQSGDGYFSNVYDLPFKVDNIYTGNNGRTYTLNLPYKWSKELGQTLGWLIGDGWLRDGDKDTRVGFTFGNDDLEVLNRLKPFINNIYGKDVKEVKRSNGVYHLSYHSKYFVEFFKELGVKHVKAENKQVPQSIYKAPYEAVVGFLQALFTADGSVRDNPKSNSSWVVLTSKSKKLLQGVQMLLINLGIKSVILNRSRKPREGMFKYISVNGEERFYNTDGILYELGIFGESRDKFAKIIGFMSERKQKALSNIKYKSFYKVKFYDEVISIEHMGKETVYDLTEPITHSMICNGIVVHQCGEQPLLPYESCNLGSINLKNMLKEENGKYEVDYEKLRDTVHNAVHFLDNVIDANKYPLPQIDEMTKGTRKIGLGVMGFADMLLMLNIPYNSEEAVEFADKLMKFIDEESKKASMELAKKRGVFKYFDKSIYKDKNIKLRNATTTTIAPTGTISIIAGTSSGIEPLFAIAMTRNVMDNTQLVEVNPIFKEVALKRGFYSDELMKKIAEQGTLKGIDSIPDDVKKVFVTAHDIDPVWHIRMQAAFQKHVDNAVSKTVNFRHDATVDDVREVYELAYRLGLKGVTIYRDGSRDSQVLNLGIKKDKKEDVKEDIKGNAEGNQIVPRPRPPVTKGITEKVRIGCGNLYITVNYDDKGICEVFTNLGRAGGCPSQSEATSRLISIALRSGLDAKSIVEQLKGIRCHSTLRQMANNKEIKVLSCPDAIAKVIEKVMKLKVEENENFAPIDVPINGSSDKYDDEEELYAAFTDDSHEDHFCPECGSEIEHEGGCVVCKNCGYSKCG
ncbi:adenosylcobalamin-dependent ribonucleoside-diphosphate reductase [Thermoanaerobacterium thermosaccharolyticum]|uniref:adenosylcobalamin-dependent ribonucleoside-diphosphate reductase n=1 Tax=Thermoanaerobacterium thermosaccharolyticum TaxID=1517 RepID=UPI0020A3C9B2|nr:adenosylcobalamin-dependent ribonucleoside-diphosphate reductase [Thermoanaerobacterium thermosaccharolyticum]